jgi:protein-tyrosine phosphatase
LIDDSIDQNASISNIIQILKYHIIECNKKVLVICSAGLSRSPYICARYLAMAENRTIDDVYKELKELNWGIDDKSPLMCNDVI